MKKFLLGLLLVLGIGNAAFSQQLNEYKYVKVPDSFEFLKEENQYQLNELTVFLLEKQGFVVFYRENVPSDIDFCDVLQAEVTEDSGLFTTRLILMLKTCSGEIVFTSEKGTSREKQYKEAFQEALRDAFTSLEAANYAYTGKTAERIAAKSEKAVDAITEEISGNEKVVAEKALPEVVTTKSIPDTLSLRNGEVNYLLLKSEGGFNLFKGTEAKPFAKLIKSSNGSSYIYSSASVQGNAYFDADGSLVVEYLDQGSGQLISIHYSQQ